MQGGLGMATGLKRALLTNKLAQVGELIGVFIPACAVIMVARPLIGDNPLARHGVVFVINVLMLVIVWLGLRARGQGCEHFGLSFRLAGRRSGAVHVLQ